MKKGKGDEEGISPVVVKDGSSAVVGSTRGTGIRVTED